MPKMCGPSQELLGDGLHPTAKGLMTIAQCLMPLVNKLAGSNATASHIAAGNVTAHASFQDVQGTHQQTDLLSLGTSYVLILPWEMGILILNDT